LIHPPLRRWPVLVILLTLSTVVTGCASSRPGFAGSSWPGILTTDDTIYVAFATQVYAIDRDSGEQLWAFPPEPSSQMTFFAPPVLGEGVLVVGDYNGVLYGLDPTNGRKSWDFAPTNEARFLGLLRYSQFGRFVAGALIEGDTVYVGSADGNLYALDVRSGEEKWRFRAGNEIWSTPLLADGTLYITSLDHHLYAIDPTNGDEVWHYEAGGAIASTPVMHDGTLYFAAFDNLVYALDAQTQEVVWTYPTENWVFSSPAFTDGRLIVADLNGNVYCLMAESGEVCWQFKTEAETPMVGPPPVAPVVGPPVIVGDAVYFTSGDKSKNIYANIYALDLESGEERAKITVENKFTNRFIFFTTGTSERGVPLYAPPVPLGDLILIGFNQGNFILRAYSPETWQAEWSFPPGE
jgi:outer membrane protein assembly factor BamB